MTLTVPGFYFAYKNRQRHILFHVLSNDLSPEMLGEACSLYASGLIRRDKRGWRAATSKFLIAYEVDRILGVNLYDQNVSILRELALCHLSIQTIAWKQAQWAMSNRPHLCDNPHLRVVPLSSTEQTRFYRAFYHYEIFAALFGRTPMSPAAGNHGLRTLYFARVSALLDSYDEWEIEESNCVRHFIHTFYQEVLERHASDLGVKLASSMSENVERVITATPFRQYLFQYGKVPASLGNNLVTVYRRSMAQRRSKSSNCPRFRLPKENGECQIQRRTIASPQNRSLVRVYDQH